jgi:hypothetical protein
MAVCVGMETFPGSPRHAPRNAASGLFALAELEDFLADEFPEGRHPF